MVSRRVDRSDVGDNGLDSDPELSRRAEVRIWIGSGFTVTGSGDIGPSVAAGDTDRNALTGVFVGLIVLIVLGAMFITASTGGG